MSAGWSIYIIVITIANIVACLWLIVWTMKKRKGEGRTGDTTGHTWDDDLQELNNPLPMWWLGLFIITILFSFGYFYLYPGLGDFSGTAKWSQRAQYEQEMAAAEKSYGPIFAAYAREPVETLIRNDKAMASGHRLFLNYCATCHGSDAGGSTGFPNLTDNDWLYGGTPQAIKASILDGRNGLMPPMGAGMTDTQLADVTAYVLSLSGRDTADIGSAEEGKKQYQILCIGCHGSRGEGNSAAGFPRLSDSIWLYGGTPGAIKQTIKSGRNGHMPAHRAFLGEEKAHLLAAYVYSLSQ